MPAGAFIVVVCSIAERYGLANLLIATSLAGVLMFVLELFKLGALVRYVPLPIVIGFTNGIAVLIAVSQLRDLLGLHIPGKLPGDFFSLLHVLATNLASVNAHAVGLGALCVGGLLERLSLEQRLDGRPLPAFALPDFTWETAKQLLIPTLTIAMLGAIESLLCARARPARSPASCMRW